MATTTITNVAALTAILDFALSNGFADEEVAEKVQKHISQLSKPSKKSDGPTKTQIINSNLIDKIVSHLKATGAVMTVKDVAAWLSENCGETVGLCSTQKATALLTQAAKNGLVRRTTDGKRIAFYTEA